GELRGGSRRALALLARLGAVVVGLSRPGRAAGPSGPQAGAGGGAPLVPVDDTVLVGGPASVAPRDAGGVRADHRRNDAGHRAGLYAVVGLGQAAAGLDPGPAGPG